MISTSSISYFFLVQLFMLLQHCTADTNKTLGHTYPVYTIIKLDYLLQSTTCGKQIKDLRDALDKNLQWSLKVIDSNGGPTSGFIYGNNFWLGKRSQCVETNIKKSLPLSEKVLKKNTKYRRLEEEFPPYTLKYFIAYLRHNNTVQYHVEYINEDLIILGICLPASCSSSQLSILFENAIRKRSFIIDGLYSAHFKLDEIKDLIDDYHWLSSGTFISIISFLIVTCIFVVAGTIYDVLIDQRSLKKLSPRTGSMCAYKNVDMEREVKNLEGPLKTPDYVEKILLSFSIFSNSKTIFNTEINSNTLPVLDGLRFFSSLWIIALHTFYMSLDFADNKSLFLRELDTFFSQIIFNSAFAVDTFFFLSGFLLVFAQLTSESSSSKSSYQAKVYNFFLDILKRFIRITPAYMTALGLFLIASTILSKTSEFYISSPQHEICPKYWWRNILYISNFFYVEDLCMPWSWYLSNDMQYYVIGSFLLVLSSMCFNVAVCILSLFLIASIIVSGYLSYIYKLVLTFDGMYAVFNTIYIAPWTRIGPYIVGMTTGYIVTRLGGDLHCKKTTILFFWIFWSLCNILAFFGYWERQINFVALSFYQALSRTVWAIGLAWIVISCNTKHGGIVNYVLSFKYWMPLSRLTYCVYLIHPIIFLLMNSLSEISIHYEWTQLLNSFLACSVISYVCAYIFSLMFELPYINLSKQIFNYLRKNVKNKRE